MDKTHLESVAGIADALAEELKRAVGMVEENPSQAFFQIGAVATTLKRMAIEFKEEAENL